MYRLGRSPGEDSGMYRLGRSPGEESGVYRLGRSPGEDSGMYRLGRSPGEDSGMYRLDRSPGEESGVYRLGKVEKQIGRQQRYTVTWEDGKCGEQMSIHIYGTYTKTIKFKVDSYILALADPDNNYFPSG
ncbi:translation initiation factor IF-2-like [Haliotis rufescens]|uniref:translation initiation factor IF-2-like n=1 Tax=Haliotis rufescens TaxID=6454 RepID=UPI00201F7F42|nr:translation initiation factor IF-2-like [Haliotis rufescens]